MRTYEHSILNESVDGTINTDVVDVRHLTFLSLQYKTVGTIVADFTVQISNDNVNFISIPETTQSITEDSDGIIEIVDMCAAYVRVHIEVTSGESNVQITMVNKGIN